MRMTFPCAARRAITAIVALALVTGCASGNEPAATTPSAPSAAPTTAADTSALSTPTAPSSTHTSPVPTDSPTPRYPTADELLLDLHDPEPGALDPAGRLGATGGTVGAYGAAITVPPGALTGSDTVTAAVGAPLGPIRSTFGAEIFGAPVSLDIAGSLALSAKLSWKNTGLSATQLRSVVAAQWDDGLRVWQLAAVRPQVNEDSGAVSFTAKTAGLWTWVANVASPAALISTPAQPGACREVRLPDSLQITPPQKMGSVVACPEENSSGEVVLRLRSNAPHALEVRWGQAATLRALTASGRQLPDNVAGLYGAVGLGMTKTTGFLLPAFGEAIVDFVAAEGEGSALGWESTVTAGVTSWSQLADVLASRTQRLSMRSIPNPWLQAAMQAVAECALAAGSGRDVELADLLAATTECTTDILRSDTPVAERWGMLRSAAAAGSSLSDADAVRAQRFESEWVRALAGSDFVPADLSSLTGGQITQATHTVAKVRFKTVSGTTGSGEVPSTAAQLLELVLAGVDASADDFAQAAHAADGEPVALGGNVRVFTSPSGNISCGLASGGGGESGCQIRSRLWDPPAQISCGSGTFDPGFVALTAGGGEVGRCGSAQPFPLYGAELAYGSTVTFGDFACRSETSFVACASVDTGAGFLLSRSDITLIDG